MHQKKQIKEEKKPQATIAVELKQASSEQSWPKKRAKGTTKNLEKIKELLNQIEKSVNQLFLFAKNSEPEVRFDAIEALRQVISIESQECLYEALDDRNELVRTSALEWFGEFYQELDFNAIALLLEDESQLVRGTAAICLADIGAPCAEELIKKKLEGGEDEEKVSYLFALCKLGRKEHFLSLLNFLFHDFYRIRTAVANLLVELVDGSNAAFVLNLLTVQSSREETISAKSAIDTAILMIKKQWPETKKKRRQKAIR